MSAGSFIKNVPLFDLNYDEREQNAVLDVLKSKWISTGPQCEAFEKEFAQKMNVSFALSLSNCTVALHLALIICGVKEGDEVILPSLTFVATANAIRYVGATPVFADIESIDDLTISPSDIEKCITPKTSAIMVMHYGGYACDMESISKIAKKYDLKIIEDACHAPLGKLGDTYMGAWGDMGCFSFFSNKNMATGEGGMLVTTDEELYKKAKLMRSHGMTTLSYQRAGGHATSYDVVTLGYNYRMDDIHASIGRVQLQKLEGDIQNRRRHVARYIHGLSDVNDVTVPFKAHRGTSSHYIFPIWVSGGEERRDALRAHLKDNGVMTSMHYKPVHSFSIYEEFSRTLPKTMQAVEGLITLPLYGHMDEDAPDYVCKVLKEGLSKCQA